MSAQLGRSADEIMKTKSTCIAIVALACSVVVAATDKHNVKPENGYVPDEATAIAIAVAVWNPIYGKEKIQKQKPALF